MTTKLIIYKIPPPPSFSQFSNLSIASYILIRFILVVGAFLSQTRRPQSLQVPLKSFLFKVSCFTNLHICEQTSLISNSSYEIMSRFYLIGLILNIDIGRQISYMRPDIGFQSKKTQVRWRKPISIIQSQYPIASSFHTQGLKSFEANAFSNCICLHLI